MSTVAIGSIIGAGVSAAGSIAGASTQASAAKQGQELQAQEAQNALDFQKQEWTTQQANEAPFLKAGTQAENTLSGLTSTPGEGLLTPWTGQFNAPTADQAKATPGFQFEMDQGINAVQNSAAANGGALNSGTQKGIAGFAENLASTNYQQTYNNALSQYQTAYNTFQNNQTNTFNRLATQAGVAQTTASQLGQEGQQASQNAGNISLTTGAQQAQSLNNAAAATASGYTGVANAANSGLSGVTGALTLQQLLAGQSNANNPYGYGTGQLNPETTPLPAYT